MADPWISGQFTAINCVLSEIIGIYCLAAAPHNEAKPSEIAAQLHKGLRRNIATNLVAAKGQDHEHASATQQEALKALDQLFGQSIAHLQEEEKKQRS